MNKKYYLIFSVIFVLFTVSLISAGSFSGKLSVSSDGGTITITGPGGPPSAYYCGNNILETYISEQCDGSNLGGESCVGLGYDSGVLSCKLGSNGCQWETSGCANDATNGDTGGDTGGTTGGTTGGRSSGGGGSGCVENWECKEWGECEDGKQTRICKERNNSRN